MNTDHEYELSVVVACPEPGSMLDRCIEALCRTCDGLSAEIIVVDSTSSAVSSRVVSPGHAVRVVRMAPGTLTPKLWSRGLASATGRVVAFTIAQCIVAPTWARALLHGSEEGHGGVAGALDIGSHARLADWAVFYLRYARYIAPPIGVPASIELPGDNAAYHRDDLVRHSAAFANGFWEVEFHRLLRAEGRSLAFVNGATATLEVSAGVRATISNRLTHGRHYGSWRVAAKALSPWRALFAAPLVPALLALRIARGVMPHRQHRARLLMSLPLLTLFAIAWALGEAVGAFSHTHSPQLTEVVA